MDQSDMLVPKKGLTNYYFFSEALKDDIDKIKQFITIKAIISVTAINDLSIM
jgi:hypothetical protein